MYQMAKVDIILLGLYSISWFVCLFIKDASLLLDLLWGLSFSIQSFEFFINSKIWGTHIIAKGIFAFIMLLHGLRLTLTFLSHHTIKKDVQRISDVLRDKLGWHFWYLSYPLLFMPQLFCNLMVGSVIFKFLSFTHDSISFLWFVTGLSIMCFGSLLEIVSDIQMYMFKKDRRNEGKILNTGFRAISRHPNYLGECIFWWGAFLVNYSAGIWVTFISPIMNWIMVRFITGVPVQEKLMISEYGDKYREYMRNTPMFIPFLPTEDTYEGMNQKGPRVDSTTSAHRADIQR